MTDNNPDVRKPLILIAEDVESNYKFLEIILKKEYDLLWAKNGREAVDFAMEHKPDAILMDIKMPVMDGIEALKEIRRYTAELPVIMQTAYAFDTDRRTAEEAGCTDEHALKERHVESIRRIARTHPMVLIDVATINPFDNSHARDVFDAGSDRRIPAFLRTGKTAQEVRTHREYLSASIRHELNRCGSTVIRADSSERMFREFVRMVSASLSRSTRNQLKAPSSLTLGGKA